MPHPNLVHVDALTDEPVQDLGAAAGAFRARAARVRLAPGATGDPAAPGREQLTYVVAGAGLAVNDGGRHALGAGDCLLQRPDDPPQRLIAGEDGLELLAFSAPAPVAAAPDDGPPTVLAIADVPPSEVHRGRFRAKLRYAGAALGARFSGMRHVRVAPGAQSLPHHCHSAEEELFVVLGGAGEVRLGDERLPVERGHVLARPPGTGVAHSFVAGEGGLELLTWGTWEPNDICFYPDSGKVFLCGAGVIGRLELCDYWDGEE